MDKTITKTKIGLGMCATIIIVVLFRELALIICTAFGLPTAANIVALVALFILLVIVRISVGLPAWLSSSANRLLTDSGFAFLPVSAGAGILLFGLGADLLPVSAIIIISTIMPLWVFAKLASMWLSESKMPKAKDGSSSETGSC